MKLLIAALLALGASSVFAQGSVTIASGPCVHIHDPYRCANYPTGECFWDEADQRCENRYNYEDRCSQIYNPYRCTNSVYGCFWDYDDQRCERY